MSAPFAWIAISFILGILAESKADIPFLFLVVSALICLVAAILSLNKSRFWRGLSRQRQGKPRASGVVPASDGTGPVPIGINPLNSIFLLLLVFLTGCLSCTLTGTGKNSVEFSTSHIKNFVEKEPVEVIVSGVIDNDPFKKDDGYGGFYSSFLFRLDKVRRNGVWQKVDGTTLVNVSETTVKYEYGDELIAKGEISSVPDPTNPGQFNYARYLARQKVYAVFKVKDERDVLLTGRNKLNPIIKLGFSIRQRLERSIEEHLPPQEAGLLSAMLLGQRQDLDLDLKDTFIQTGTVQVLATQYTKKHIY